MLVILFLRTLTIFRKFIPASKLDIRPRPKDCEEPTFTDNLVKTVTLGSIAKFFLLPIVIWHSNTTEFGVMLHLILVTGYYFSCLTQAYSGTTLFTSFYIQIKCLFLFA